MSANDVLKSLKCTDELKRQLKSAYTQHLNDPRELNKQFEKILSGSDWRWDLLDKAPDTLMVMQLSPAELLAGTLLRSDSLTLRISQWKKVLRTRPLAIIKRVGDKRDFPECIAAAGQIVGFSAVNTPVFPMHRLGCRCYFITGTKKHFERK